MIKTLTPALFILNYRLPHITGIDLYDRLHAQPDLAHVPAMMVSANLPKDELVQRGIVGLEKPLDINDFVDAVKQLVC